MQKNRIVVLGGSFNPPTKAHQAIMSCAMQSVSANTGIFVPSSEAYVRRKMSKNKHDNQVYSEEERKRMLLSCLNGNMQVSTVEFGDDGRGHTYDTLSKIQTENPDSEIWFIIGADKLSILPRWKNHDALLSQFHFIVLTRGMQDIMSIICNDETLRKYEDHFHACSSPDFIDNISSTSCRQLINNRKWDKLASFMDENAIAIIREGGMNND